MVNRTVAGTSTMQSFMRNARCQRHAAGRNMIPYNNSAAMNQPTRMPRIVSSNVAAGIRRNTRYNARTVINTHSHFHLFEIRPTLRSVEVSPLAEREVARIVTRQNSRPAEKSQSAITLGARPLGRFNVFAPKKLGHSPALNNAILKRPMVRAPPNLHTRSL